MKSVEQWGGSGHGDAESSEAKLQKKRVEMARCIEWLAEDVSRRMVAAWQAGILMHEDPARFSDEKTQEFIEESVRVMLASVMQLASADQETQDMVFSSSAHDLAHAQNPLRPRPDDPTLFSDTSAIYPELLDGEFREGGARDIEKRMRSSEDGETP